MCWLVVFWIWVSFPCMLFISFLGRLGFVLGERLLFLLVFLWVSHQPSWLVLLFCERLAGASSSPWCSWRWMGYWSILGGWSVAWEAELGFFHMCSSFYFHYSVFSRKGARACISLDSIFHYVTCTSPNNELMSFSNKIQFLFFIYVSFSFTIYLHLLYHWS